MALKGFSESLGARGVMGDLKVVAAASAGVLYMIGSGENYVQLASQAVAFVLDWDVTAAGVEATDVLLGTEVQETKVDSQARLRPLAPGDTIRTNQLASGSDTGAISGTTALNAALGIDPATGKLRAKQATDVELFRVASDGGNLFDTDGSIWAEVVALK
jgi:hypothetical protein